MQPPQDHWRTRLRCLYTAGLNHRHRAPGPFSESPRKLSQRRYPCQNWIPVWGALERHWRPGCRKREGAGQMSGTLHLAQALSNRGRRGRKKDFRDAERLVKRLISQELILSFVPDAEQRLWRRVTPTK